MNTREDLILVGAGLANGLIALRLRALRPELRVRVLERGPAAGGNHTWSFHHADLTPAQHAWIAPLVHTRWPGYRVRFPQRQRHLASGYASILSETFAAHLQQALGETLECGVDVHRVTPTRVEGADGRVLEAAAVIDGRGARASRHMALGHQAFLGRVLRTARPHGVALPLIMDATVAQGDGYRFVYVLPFSDDMLLVEDTHYVDDDRPDFELLGRHVADYAREHGWEIAEVLREERGVLPITLAGDFEAFWAEGGDMPRAGLAAGLFHPTTGYSLPHAVRLADRLAQMPSLDAASVLAATRAEAESAWRAHGFYRLLNRMLFLAGRPQDRWRVMQRFYGLPEALIARFYAGRTTWPDRLRILAGKPPVPVGEALRAMRMADAAHIRTHP